MTCSRRHVLITGTSSGIGRATVAAAVDAGFHVFAGDRSAGPVGPEQLQDDVTRVHLDVTDPDDIGRAVQVIDEHVGAAGLDAVANIAGIGLAGPLELVDLERLRTVYEVNVFGQLALTQPVIPLVRRARGRFVFVGSVGDRLTVPFAGPLTSSKAAIAFLTHTLRQELSPWGIRVILIEPGSIHTPAVEAMQADVQATLQSWTDEEKSLYADSFSSVLGNFLEEELHGSPPETVAETILTALTTSRPKAHYLTGAGSRKLATLARLPQSAQDAAKRRIFGLPDPGSAADR